MMIFIPMIFFLTIPEFFFRQRMQHVEGFGLRDFFDEYNDKNDASESPESMENAVHYGGLIDAVVDSIQNNHNQQECFEQLQNLAQLNDTLFAALCQLDENCPVEGTRTPLQELLQFLTAQCQEVIEQLLCLHKKPSTQTATESTPIPNTSTQTTPTTPTTPPYKPIDLAKLFRGQSAHAVRAAVQALCEIVQQMIEIVQPICQQKAQVNKHEK